MAETSQNNNPHIALITAIAVAGIGLLGQAIVSYLNTQSEITLAEQKLQQQLLLSAVNTDKDTAIDNLRFLIETGLLLPSAAVDIPRLTSALDNQRIFTTDRRPNLLSLPIVAYIQRELDKRGMDIGHADGFLGPQTRIRIQQYQTEHGLEATGLPSIELIETIQNDHLQTPRNINP